VRKDEAGPRLEGELEVLDCESGESLALSVDQALLDRYENAYEAFRATLAAFANARGIGVLELLAEDPVVPQVAQLFARGGAADMSRSPLRRHGRICSPILPLR
jgi:hypothetical protein